MDSKDLEAEIHPLRNEDKRLPETPGNPGHADEKLKSSPRQPRLSRCRTVVFFLSLFVCLFVVFVVSFIIPCPERPVSQGMWRIDYSAAVTYDFLATEDINRDRIQDVLFLYKNANGSNNFNLSCTDEGFSSPCTFVAAVSGASGSVLWERPAAQDGALVRCSVPQTQGSRMSSACILVGRPSSFVAVDLFTGETLWSQPPGFDRNTSDLSSLLQLPDVDADGAPDLLLLAQEDKEVSSYLYSGSTGRQIGHRGSLGVGGTAGSLLHVTRAGAHYILFPCRTLGLCLQDRPSRGSHMPKGAEWGKPGSPGRVLVPEGQGWPTGSAGEVGGGHPESRKQAWQPCPESPAFRTASSLCGCSVKGLHEAATGGASPLRRDLLWERMLNTTPHGPLGRRLVCVEGAGAIPGRWVHLISTGSGVGGESSHGEPAGRARGEPACHTAVRSRPRSPGALRHLTHVPGKAGEDLLLVTSEACVLLDGQDLTPRWTFRTAQVFRKPILGHYKPDTPAVVIENGTGTNRQILLLDLGSGAILWNQALPGLPGDPQSASLPTADHRSAFFFWGLHELSELSGTNQTRPQDAQHSLYMFHPTLPGVLLELANISANIVSFQAVLFEPSRHAACVLLMGPAGPDTPGTVSVAKHKVQDLVPGSRVVRLAEGGPDTDQAVRDRFSRLRYRSEA
uniref:Protein FAM234A n=1 Tax=Canis lupus familiaris TaxID=9615 RepID=A0A8P0PGM3_CANLF